MDTAFQYYYMPEGKGLCAMRILVLSDSHGVLRFMRLFVEKIRPDAIIHLGDHFDDAKVIAEENRHIVCHMVPGNCDSYLRDPWQPDVLSYAVGGVRMYMTHGHKHGIKSCGLDRLFADARASKAQAVLFGHTHEALCYREKDGLWVINPGSCKYSDSTAAVIETVDNEISACHIVRQTELDNWE